MPTNSVQKRIPTEVLSQLTNELEQIILEDSKNTNDYLSESDLKDKSRCLAALKNIIKKSKDGNESVSSETEVGEDDALEIMHSIYWMSLSIEDKSKQLNECNSALSILEKEAQFLKKLNSSLRGSIAPHMYNMSDKRINTVLELRFKLSNPTVFTQLPIDTETLATKIPVTDKTSTEHVDKQLLKILDDFENNGKMEETYKTKSLHSDINAYRKIKKSTISEFKAIATKLTGLTKQKLPKEDNDKISDLFQALSGEISKNVTIQLSSSKIRAYYRPQEHSKDEYVSALKFYQIDAKCIQELTTFWSFSLTTDIVKEIEKDMQSILTFTLEFPEAKLEVRETKPEVRETKPEVRETKPDVRETKLEVRETKSKLTNATQTPIDTNTLVTPTHVTDKKSLENVIKILEDLEKKNWDEKAYTNDYILQIVQGFKKFKLTTIGELREVVIKLKDSPPSISGKIEVTETDVRNIVHCMRHLGTNMKNRANHVLNSNNSPLSERSAALLIIESDAKLIENLTSSWGFQLAPDVLIDIKQSITTALNIRPNLPKTNPESTNVTQTTIKPKALLPEPLPLKPQDDKKSPLELPIRTEPPVPTVINTPHHFFENKITLKQSSVLKGNDLLSVLTDRMDFLQSTAKDIVTNRPLGYFSSMEGKLRCIKSEAKVIAEIAQKCTQPSDNTYQQIVNFEKEIAQCKFKINTDIHCDASSGMDKYVNSTIEQLKELFPIDIFEFKLDGTWNGPDDKKNTTDIDFAFYVKFVENRDIEKWKDEFYAYIDKKFNNKKIIGIILKTLNVGGGGYNIRPLVYELGFDTQKNKLKPTDIYTFSIDNYKMCLDPEKLISRFNVELRNSILSIYNEKLPADPRTIPNAPTVPDTIDCGHQILELLKDKLSSQKKSALDRLNKIKIETKPVPHPAEYDFLQESLQWIDHIFKATHTGIQPTLLPLKRVPKKAIHCCIIYDKDTPPKQELCDKFVKELEDKLEKNGFQLKICTENEDPPPLIFLYFKQIEVLLDGKWKNFYDNIRDILRRGQISWQYKNTIPIFFVTPNVVTKLGKNGYDYRPAYNQLGFLEKDSWAYRDFFQSFPLTERGDVTFDNPSAQENIKNTMLALSSSLYNQQTNVSFEKDLENIRNGNY